MKIYKGKEYNSKKALAKAYGINEKKFCERLRVGWSIEQALEHEERNVGPTSKKKIYIDEKEFKSLRKAAEYLDIPYTNFLRDYNKNGGNYNPIEEEPLVSIKGNTRPFLYDRHIYPSLNLMLMSCNNYDESESRRLSVNFSNIRVKCNAAQIDIEDLTVYGDIDKPKFINDFECFIQEVSLVFDLANILFDATEYLQDKLVRAAFSREAYLRYHNMNRPKMEGEQ